MSGKRDKTPDAVAGWRREWPTEPGWVWVWDADRPDLSPQPMHLDADDAFGRENRTGYWFHPMDQPPTTPEKPQ